MSEADITARRPGATSSWLKTRNAEVVRPNVAIVPVSPRPAAPGRGTTANSAWLRA